MRKLLAALLILAGLSPYPSHCQTFTGATGAISDNGPVTYFPINVSGLSASTIDTTFGVESVCITLFHSYVSDLVIRLQAPDGTITDLSISNGGSGNNYNSTCFNDLASNNITSGNPPFNGNYRPQQPLYQVNNGQNPNGTWNLLIQDIDNPDAGTLTSCSITFGNNPGTPFPFTSSNLPVIKINTLNQSIADDPKIHCRMQVIDNGPGVRNYFTDTVYTYEGWIGIEFRGSSSQMFPKKSYGVELRDSMQNDTSVSLLGMPPESDWVFNANYTDKSFMRNTLAYDLYNKMGWYSSRTRYAEVFVNNIYEGIYVICEKIKRDSNRVDIAKLTNLDNTWPDVSGGYILKVDKTTGGGGQGFTSLFPPLHGGPNPTILYDYPEYTELTFQQEAYIVAYMDSFETALHGPNYTDTAVGYRKYADMNSFIDFLLLNEMSKCVDSYRISAYLYKEKQASGGKLFAGPVWDFDIAFGNADYYNGQYTSGWSYSMNIGNTDMQVPFWWSRFMQDNNFKNTLKCRWNDLRNGSFSTANVLNWIDSVALVLNESQQRNFQRWPILGIYVWPNPSPIPQTYPDEVLDLKNWISDRLTYMDMTLPGICTTTSVAENIGQNDVIVYPNPAQDFVHIISHSNLIEEVSLTDISGREVLNENAQQSLSFTLPTAQLNPGIYLLQVKNNKGILKAEKIIIE